nr:serine/threonine-protein phosphatase [Actinomycetota bacterium]
TLDLSDEPWRSFLAGSGAVAEVGGGAMAKAGFQRGVIALIPGPDLIGALLFIFKDEFSLGPGEPEAVELAAAQAATAIEMARRYERQKSAARSLQRGLVMVDMPVLDCCDFAAVSEPADSAADIGGDFFDVFELPDGRIAMTVGDVSGKGAEAAAQTAMAKYMLRAFAMRNSRPSSVLFHLNNALVRSLGGDRFTTAVYATYEQQESRCEVALGGHPPPFVYRQESHAIERVAPSGILLGVFEDQDYPTETVVLGPGDALIAFTDGLVEARRGADLYGNERLVESVLDHAPSSSATELVDRVYEDAKSFGIVSDDIVVLAMVCGRQPSK